MDTYRTEKQATIRITLEDEDAEIDPIQGERGGGRQEPLLEFLSLILDEFNKTWGNAFSNPDHVEEIIRAMPDRVNDDTAYQNAKMYSDRQNAEIEFQTALFKQVTESLRDGTEFYKKFTEDPDFKRWLSDRLFTATYERSDEG